MFCMGNWRRKKNREWTIWPRFTRKMAVMWWSWPKFAFNKCEFQLPNLFECKCCSIGLRNMKTGSASCVVPNKRSEPKTRWVKLTAFVGHRGPAASLPEMTCVFVAFEAICFIRTKFFIGQGLCCEFAFDRTLFKTFKYDETFEVRTSANVNSNFVTYLAEVVCVWGCDGVLTRIQMMSDSDNFSKSESLQIWLIYGGLGSAFILESRLSSFAAVHPKVNS